MINYNDIKVTAVTTEKDYYDSKKKKRIKYNYNLYVMKNTHGGA